jgi:hypothetical protein
MRSRFRAVQCDSISTTLSFASDIVPKTARPPIFRPLQQAVFRRIAMYVVQLLHPLALTPHVEIIIARLPKASAGTDPPQFCRKPTA